MHTHSHGNAPRLRRFAITVDGVRHEVVVEELDAGGRGGASTTGSLAGATSIGGATSPGVAATSPGVAATAAGGTAVPGGSAIGSGGSTAIPGGPTQAVTVGSPAAAAGDSGGDGALDDGWIVAPMPGTVTEIVANVGDTVNRGDVIVILTAMKLENEITAPATGVIQSISVNEGDNVNNGDRLVQLSTEGAHS